MPNTFKESTGHATVYEALHSIGSPSEAQNFFATYIAHLSQTEGWGIAAEKERFVRDMIKTNLRPEQRPIWNSILGEEK